MVVLTLLVLACGVIAIAKASFLFGTAALFLGIWELIVSQSVSFKDMEKQTSKKDADSRNRKDAEETDGSLSGKNEKQKETAEEESDSLKNYSEKKLKQLMAVYKVKKTSRTVIVDESKSWHISQCPAYIWRTSGKVHLLLLEKKPRRIDLDYGKIRYVLHEKGVPADPARDYEELTSPSVVGSLFSKYLPAYYEIIKGGRRMIVKNRYVIAPDIKFTNTSAASLFDLLDVGFKVDDEYIRSARFSDYFKEAYRFNILWKDGIYSANEYKNKIQALLKRMTDETPHQEELSERLEQMVAFRLITQEYADFYLQHKK